MRNLLLLCVLCDLFTVPVLILVAHVDNHHLESVSQFKKTELPFSVRHSVLDELVISIVRGCVGVLLFGSVPRTQHALKHSKIFWLALVVCAIGGVYSVVKCAIWPWVWNHTQHQHLHVLHNVVVIVETVVGVLYALSLAHISRKCSTFNASLTQSLVESTPQSNQEVKKKAKTSTSLKRVASLASPEKPLLFGGVVALTIAAVSNMVVPFMLGKLIDVVGQDDSTTSDLNSVIITMLLAFIISSIATCARGVAFNVAGERMVARLRRSLFWAIVRQEMGFFDGVKSGEMVNRLSADTTVVQDIATVNISMGLRWAAQAIIGTIVLFVISWQLTLVMLASIPAVSALAVVYGRFTRRISKDYQKALADAGEVAAEVLGNIKTVRSLFKGEHREAQRYYNSVNESYHHGKLRAYAYGGWSGIVMLFAYLAIVLCLWYGGREVLHGKMKAGFLTSFLLYTIYIAVALGGLADLFTKLMTAVGASERMFELIDRTPGIPTEGGLQPENIDGHILLEEVEFSYPQRPDVKVLDKITLECKPSQVTALVGKSGAGKSTVVSLIERFYDPQAGRVLLDGVDLKQIDPQWLHKQVALVAQEPVLMSCSIAENIANGTDHCTREDIISAAKLANAHDFISQFPNGYDTLVGERGVQLSGGQKQRVAIARAVVGNPKILLLDEATSALDAQSEHLVQAAIDSLMADRTVVIVAHRLSTVRSAGRVVVFDGSGKIAQTGTHDELCKNEEGLYFRLVQRQLQ